MSATPMRKQMLWLVTAGAFFSFFVFGFVDNLKGPTLPSLLEESGLSYSQGGTILFAAYIGFVVATLLTGVLADYAGNRLVLALAGLLLSVGIAAFANVSTFWLLALSLALVGLGLGAIEVGGNALIVELHSRQRGRYLNLLAVVHGIGSLIAPLIAALLLSRSISWRFVYQLALLLPVVLAAFFLLVRVPSHSPSTTGGWAFAVLGRSAFSLRMCGYYLMLALYVAAELGVAAWLVEFLQQAKGFTVGVSALYLSLFFAAIMLGRLAGSFVVEGVGYLRAMLLAAVAATACLAIGTFGPPPVAFFLPLSGLFLSIIFPTTTAAVSRLHSENIATIMGVLFAFGGLGGAIGPWAIGFAADRAGIDLGFGLTVVYAALVMVSLAILGAAGSRRSG